MLATALAVLVVSEVAVRYGLRHFKAENMEGPSAVIEASMYSLLALLLAFSYSLAVGRYDARRAVFIDETNSIGTTYLRTQLLDPAAAAQMRAALRDYVRERLDFIRSEDASPEQAAIQDDSATLQRAMWSLAMKEAARDPRSTMIPLFVSSLNETIDLSTKEGAALSAHIPDIVILLLIALIVVTAGMLGTMFARIRQHAVAPRVVYAFALAIAIGLVFDLDRPQRGLIRVNLQAMQTLQQSMQR
jgi:hypothetical protein